MKIVFYLQNTPEWEALRKNKVGASDANIIMGMSDYCTIRELWSLKTGLTKKDPDENTFAQDKGHRLEVKNRATLEIEYGVDFPAVTGLSDIYEFLMASFDGVATIEKVWDEENNCWREDPHIVLAEFKYCGQDDFNLVLSGECLPQYKPQIQTQLTVSGARYCILGVTTENKEAIEAEINKLKAAGLWKEDSKKPQIFKYARTTIFPDLEYIEKELLPALVKFHDSVQNKIDPGYGPRDAKDESQNQALVDTLERYKLIKSELEDITALAGKVQKEIFKMVSHTKSVCGNANLHIIQKSAPVSTVIDYERFLFDHGFATIPDEYKKTVIGDLPDPIYSIRFVKSEAEKAQEAKDKEEQKAFIQAEKDKIKKEKEDAKLKAAEEKKAVAHAKAQAKAEELRKKEEEKTRIKMEKEQQKAADKEAKKASKSINAQ